MPNDEDNEYRKKLWDRIKNLKNQDESLITDIKKLLMGCDIFRLNRILKLYCKKFNLTYKSKKTLKDPIVLFILSKTPLFSKPGLVDFICEIIDQKILDIKEE